MQHLTAVTSLHHLTAGSTALDMLKIPNGVRAMIRAILKRLIRAVGGSHAPLKPPQATLIPHDILVEEEHLPEYARNSFYPVRLGDVFQGRYEVLVKLGYGTTSTIWLAQDLLCVHPVIFV